VIVPDLDGPDWSPDEVVDLICVGTGVAALAVAIAAERAGLDVLLTDDAGDVGSLSRGQVLADDATAFLVEVTDDVAAPEQPGPEPSIRRADEPDWAELRPKVVFSGAALRNWAGTCLASPYGLVSTEVAGSDAAPIPVAAVSDGVPVGHVDIDAWLPELAREHGLAARDGTRLRDLVLSGNRVVGAILSTPAGQTVVRATAGVVFSTGAAGRPGRHPVVDADVTELVIQPKPFSRFARLQFRAT